VAKIVIA